MTRLAANTTAVARAKMFGAGRTGRQAGRLRSPFSNGGRSQWWPSAKNLDLVWVWFYKEVAPTALGMNMIASFLKTDDGDFNYPAFLFSLLFLFLIGLNILQLRKALKSGCIWLVSGHGAHKKFEKEKNPTGFWIMFAIYCFGILLFVSLIIVICFGLLRKPD